jgi:CheY-like chemotaxis protein
VRGDKTKLEQVVTNLLLNAAQAIPEGVTVANEITVRTFERDEWAVIEVRDTGVGLSEEAQKRMFEPFFTTKPRGRGTGLGLAISADIVRHHGGALQMIETSPAGTAFEVLLPRVGGMMHGGELVSRPPAEDDGHPPVATSQRRRSRVLLIDDEQMLLDAYSRFFDDVYEIETALGGRRAIEHLSVDSAWDAILCDVMMPVVDGVAVYEWVTANRPALAERMLFCTGGAFTPRSMAFTERHAWRVLEKPIALGELRTALDAIAAGELL